MTDVGKLLIVAGALLVLVGVGLTVAGRLNLPLGKLPGDIVYRGKNTTVYFPIVTSIVVSVVLSLVVCSREVGKVSGMLPIGQRRFWFADKA